MNQIPVWGEGGIMEGHLEEHAQIEQIRQKVSELLSQCIEDIRETVRSSGLTMRDVGIGIEKYQISSSPTIVELKFF